MALQLGYDEGGSGDELLVSVQLGITEQAKRFERHWKKRLGRVEYFHSKDLWNFTKGPFTKAGLSRPERSQLLEDLSDYIHELLCVGITARISQKLYNENTTQDFRSQVGAAYGFTVSSLLLCAYLWMQKINMRSEVNIIIEDGHKNAGGAVLLLNRWKEAPYLENLEGLKILSVGLGSKIDHPILQAADMLAYCKHQHLINGDRAIYDALHRKGSPYHPEAVTLEMDMIREAQVLPAQIKQRMKDYWQNRPRQT
jgi:hypothetical protein